MIQSVYKIWFHIQMTTNLRIQTIVCDALDALFVYTAQQNLGPTRNSRIYYMWFHAVSSSYNWINPRAKCTTQDNWNWNIHYLVWQPRDMNIWITATLVAIMPFFVPSYDPTVLLADERKHFRWSLDQQRAAHVRVKNIGRWKQWFTAWKQWLTYRQQDGSIAASLPPKNLPNGATYIDVYDTADPATFPSPAQWTPLKLGIKKQSYLTYDWMNVQSAGITTSQDEIIIEHAKSYFPNEDARKMEIKELVSISESLTESQKIQAEFWAGGPHTISPPGMFVWFWKTYMRAVVASADLDTFFASGLDLAMQLFETGRIIWGIKQRYMQSRPIQDVRRWYRGATIIRYDGISIDGSAWIPYQEGNFVTPPFADYPSGHSAFSQIFALVMTHWFGPTIHKTYAIKHDDVKLLCPMLETQIQPFGQFIVTTGSSAIQPDRIPMTDSVISWMDWQDMANSAGISRKYGGIHATSAHTSSQAIASELHKIIIAQTQMQ